MFIFLSVFLGVSEFRMCKAEKQVVIIFAWGGVEEDGNKVTRGEIVAR